MAPDDLDRDKLYTAGADDLDSDDAELELEPPDPELLAAAERRAAKAIEAHRNVINVDEVYRDLDANRDSAIVDEWLVRLRNFRFQFQVKHLLIFTAMIAVILMLKFAFGIGLGTMLIIAFMLAVAGVSFYLKLEENKRQEEAGRRRQKMYAERRAQQARLSEQTVDTEENDE